MWQAGYICISSTISCIITGIIHSQCRVVSVIFYTFFYNCKKTYFCLLLYTSLLRNFAAQPNCYIMFSITSMILQGRRNEKFITAKGIFSPLWADRSWNSFKWNFRHYYFSSYPLSSHIWYSPITCQSTRRVALFHLETIQTETVKTVFIRSLLQLN